MPYTNAIIDLCQPFKLNIAVIGARNSGKSNLVQSLVNLLLDHKLAFTEKCDKCEEREEEEEEISLVRVEEVKSNQGLV